MFFDILSKLCTKKGISITQLTVMLGISKSNVTNWKNGSIPKSDKIQQIASYFGVSTDYLLGNETEGKSLDEQLKGIDFALHSESKELTDGEKQDVLNFVKFIKAKRENDK